MERSPLKLISQIPRTGRWMKTTDENDSRHIFRILLVPTKRGGKERGGGSTGAGGPLFVFICDLWLIKYRVSLSSKLERDEQQLRESDFGLRSEH